MKFTDFLFSNLKIHNINEKMIYIIDDHQYAFPIWANFYKDFNKQLTLVSLDYHPDTIIGFWRYSFHLACQKSPHIDTHEIANKIRLEYLEKISTSDIENLILETEKLNNDEQIKAAYELGFIKDFHMINCLEIYNELVGTHYKNESNYCNGLEEPSSHCKSKCPKLHMDYCSNRLEDNYLKELNLMLQEEKILLDFDLDYFPTRNSFNPIEKSIISDLIKRAEIITIARSKSYFDNLKLENDFSIEDAERLIIKFIANCLEN